MFCFYVEEDGMFRMKIHERPVAFVPFCDKILATFIPVRIGPEDRNFRADIVRGRLRPDLQNVGGEGGSGRFAMSPGHHDPLFP